MKPLLIILFCFLSMGFIWPFKKSTSACQDRLNAKPLAIGYNEHYAFQQRDGSIAYSIQDREYYKCSVKQHNIRSVGREEWEATLNEYRDEAL